MLWYFIPVVFPWPADDMGLGKTLTMIALILALKKKPKEGEKEDKKVENWFSKNGNKKPLTVWLLNFSGFTRVRNVSECDENCSVSHLNRLISYKALWSPLVSAST